MYVCVCMYVYIYIYISIYLPTYLSIYLSIYLYVHISRSTYVYPTRLRDLSRNSVRTFWGEAERERQEHT